MLIEGNQIHDFISSSGSGTVINYGSGSDFLKSYGSYSSGSTTLKVRVHTFVILYHTSWVIRGLAHRNLRILFIRSRRRRPLSLFLSGSAAWRIFFHILCLLVCHSTQCLSCTKYASYKIATVLRIRIRRIQMFLGLLDPDPDPLVRGMDPDPSIIKQK